MNYAYAKSLLTDGKAIKRPSWGGYIDRVDLPLPAAYDPESTLGYDVGDKVSFNSAVYECKEAIPSGSAAGPFSYAKWAGIDRDHKIRFHEAADADGDESTVYEITETVTSAGVTSSDPTPALAMDGGLFDAFAADDWIIGSASDFEAARSGERRW